MGRKKKRWTGKIVAHGIRAVVGAHAPFYGVGIDIELEDEAGRVDVLYDDPESVETLGNSLVRIALTARKHNIELAAATFRANGGETDVHTGHCCDRHGCKYAYDETDECPVVNGDKPQSHICEQCDYELEMVEENAKTLLDMRNERARARRRAKTP